MFCTRAISCANVFTLSRRKNVFREIYGKHRVFCANLTRYDYQERVYLLILCVIGIISVSRRDQRSIRACQLYFLVLFGTMKPSL